MKRLSLIVLVLCFTFAAPVMARDKNNRYEVQGGSSCGEWVKNRKEDDWISLANQTWISGFITAFNDFVPDVYSILGNTDKDSVHLWMDKYCQENPLKSVTSGMHDLTIELWPNRKRTKDD